MRTNAALALLAAATASAHAKDLFTASLVEIGNPANTLTGGDNSFPDLLDDLGDTKGQFGSFSGRTFSANISYGGVADAVRVTYLPSGGSTGGPLLRIDSIAGSSDTFVFDSANGDVGTQFEDFFLKDNPQAVTDFLQAMAERSLVAVTDGNPLSTTAVSADYKYRRFGLYEDFSPSVWQLSWMETNRRAVTPPEQNTGDAGDNALPTVSVNTPDDALRTRVDALAASVKADGFRGSWFQIAPSFELAFSERFSLVLGTPFSYNEYESADVFNLGVHLDAPITLVRPDYGADRGFTWQLTPGAAVDFSGSQDFAAGGIVYSGAINNRIAYDLRRWSFCLVQQYSIYDGQQLNVDEYTIDPGVSQQILKLGGRVTYYFSDNGFLFGGYTWTDFLEEAAVDDYDTPTAGVGFRWGNGASLVATWFADYAEDFERQALGFTFQLPF